MRLVDLTMPIEPGHLRWPVEKTVKGDLAKGDLFQATTVRIPCHGFSHVDARRHFFQDGATIEATPLEDVVGEAAVVDLRDVAPNQAIGPELLAGRCGHVGARDRIILSTGWDRHRSHRTPEFWLDAPYITREGALWLRDRAPIAIAYDFPQDFVIRLLLKGECPPIQEHVTHDILLRAGVHMIEYVVNTAQLRRQRVLLSAAPIKIPGADGAPARVYAIEDR